MIRLAVRIPQGLESIDHVKRQLPFAAALALNQVANDARDAARGSLERRFTINPGKLRFLQGLIGTDHRATKSELFSRVGISKEFGLGQGKDRNFLLTRHQEGGPRSTTADKPFFIPTDEIRGADHAVAPRALYPANLRLFARRTPESSLPARQRATKRGKVQTQGKQRTFILDARPTADPRAWGVFQRTGPGKRDIRMLWAFRTSLQLPPRLAFYDTTTQAVLDRWATRFDEALARALSTAK